MSGTQVTAAIALLKKVMPDLAAVQHSGEDGGPMTVKFVTVFEKEESIEAAWNRSIESSVREYQILSGVTATAITGITNRDYRQ